jgi:meso-butanediol dehydrogenase/(S,S)-butanediol dehydrogenase/diacetyl reductase
MSISGKVALVTGAGQGIGRAIALRLARDGAGIALVDMQRDKIEAVATEIAALGSRAVVFVADVADQEQMVAVVDYATSELGGFDIIVNNVGIAQAAPLLELTQEDVERIFQVNVQGTLWGIQAAAKKLKALKRCGKIINACSIVGHDGFALLGVYSATKFAVCALTQAAAKELAVDGITVNAYCPGLVGTDMWDEIDQRMAAIGGAEVSVPYEQYVGGIALGRTQTPEDVADFVSFLAGPASDNMTGQSPRIDGGLSLR